MLLALLAACRQEEVRALTAETAVETTSAERAAEQEGRATSEPSTQPLMVEEQESTTVPFMEEAAGYPAITIPVGYDASGSPVAYHIVGDYLSEPALITAG